MTAPSFSVVCAAYNTGPYIDATVRSVLGQSLEDFEMIVVDDGSTDDTPARVEEWAARESRITLIRQENAKPAAARNRGMAAARGRRISFIDSDDLWLPNYLETVDAALVAAPAAGLCYSDIWMLDHGTRLVYHQTFERLEQYLPGGTIEIPAAKLTERMMRDNVIPTSGTTMTREAYEATGGFNASPVLFGAEDWDLWLRVLEAGFNAVRIPDALGVWRDRAGSETTKTLMMAQGSNAAVRLALEREPDDPEITRLARLKIAETEREIARQLGPTLPIRVRAATEARLRALKHRALKKRNWREPPPEVAALLERVDPRPSAL